MPDKKAQYLVKNEDGTYSKRWFETKGDIVLMKDGSTAEDAIGARAKTITYTVNVGTTWVGSAAPYTQTITVTGITAKDNPIVDIYSNSTAAKFKLELKAYALVGKIATAANSITLTCYDKKPTTAFGLQLKVVR
nr:MAG TPA: hypothetical protein [Caudoviricetes sp.]